MIKFCSAHELHTEDYLFVEESHQNLMSDIGQADKLFGEYCNLAKIAVLPSGRLHKVVGNEEMILL